MFVCNIVPLASRAALALLVVVMANDTPIRPARSWLFAPGDSERKMTKAASGLADIVLIDLEDSVVPQAKAAAREAAAEFIASRDDRHRLWVRVNPLDGEWTAPDLDAIMPARPGGILLPKAEGRADLDTLDTMLGEREADAGIAVGTTPVAALVTETPAAMFTTGSYAGAPRLTAMTWGAEDLSSALGASEMFGADGEYLPTYELARSLCLLGAKAAGVTPLETIMSDFRDLDGLQKRARKCWRAGFRGMLAIHPAQVPVINEAFSPSAQEVRHAHAVVQAFEDSPGAGTVGVDGKMLDRPHLAQARDMIALAETHGTGSG